MQPLSIPLYSFPGKPPLLGKGFGFISISHCKNALFLGWSSSPIGVDIESINRSFDFQKLSKKLLSKEENLLLSNSIEDDLSKKFLSIWVRKEALIKYAKGNILKDFKSWKINPSTNVAFSNTSFKKAYVNYTKYKSWLIGVASDYNLSKIPEINICC